MQSIWGGESVSIPTKTSDSALLTGFLGIWYGIGMWSGAESEVCIKSSKKGRKDSRGEKAVGKQKSRVLTAMNWG